MKGRIHEMLCGALHDYIRSYEPPYSSEQLEEVRALERVLHRLRECPP